jgi:hypothetical protein
MKPNDRNIQTSAGVIPVQATHRVRSVVSIPVREGLDGSEFTTIRSESPVRVESLVKSGSLMLRSTTILKEPMEMIERLEALALALFFQLVRVLSHA